MDVLKKRERHKIEITNTRKFMEFHLVVLHSAGRTEARHFKSEPDQTPIFPKIPPAAISWYPFPTK